ncbi:MAG TPA: hypothetical protein DIW54_00300 [Chitinophagaceae bacterium]|nr:hypothetical protein [Chitinophagaceae bacterium]
MKVLLTGATGMIGGLILEQCLAANKINQVISFVRKQSGQVHPKLTEVVVADFCDYSVHEDLFTHVNAAYFCLGAYTGQVSNDMLKQITVDYAVAFARQLSISSPNAKFCLLSGAGADRTEKSKTPFALFKGMAENQIATLQLDSYSFRPGYIYPVTPRKEPNVAYRLFRFLYPIMRVFGNKYSIRSTDLAEVMFYVGINGTDKQILENADIIVRKPK